MPISLFASIIDISLVCGLIAASTSSTETCPAALTGKSQGLGRFLHQARLRRRLLGPQAMIHMGNHQKKVKGRGQLRQRLEKGHGIRPAGYRHDTALSGGKKLLASDSFFYLFYEKMHTSRLAAIIPLKKRLSLAM